MSVRRVAASTFILFLALVLHGIAPAKTDSLGALQAQTPPPRPTHTPSGPPSPRPTPTNTHPPSPRPSHTDPYPGGAGLPPVLNADAFFPVGDAAPPVERDVTSVLWIALALFGVGLVVRWFFIAARSGEDT